MCASGMLNTKRHLQPPPLPAGVVDVSLAYHGVHYRVLHSVHTVGGGSSWGVIRKVNRSITDTEWHCTTCLGAFFSGRRSASVRCPERSWS